MGIGILSEARTGKADAVLVDDVLAAVVELRSASFPNLLDRFGPRLDGAPQVAVLRGEGSNVVLWSSVPVPLVAALKELLARGLVACRTCQPLVYFVDGGVLTLPIAKGAGPYKRPRWLPVVFVPAKTTRETSIPVAKENASC